MTLRHLPRIATGDQIDRILTGMTDGSFEVIAVEVFDHRDSIETEEYGTIGPWVLGPEDEVRAWLTANGYEEFAVQYGAGAPASS